MGDNNNHQRNLKDLKLFRVVHKKITKSLSEFVIRENDGQGKGILGEEGG